MLKSLLSPHVQIMNPTKLSSSNSNKLSLPFSGFAIQKSKKNFLNKYESYSRRIRERKIGYI